MKNRSLILVSLLAVAVSGVGCASYKGLIPDKSVTMKNVKINSPWTGLPIMSADEITTVVAPAPAAEPR